MSTSDQIFSYKHIHFSGDFNKPEKFGDWTEKLIERSSNPKAKYQTYSTYKVITLTRSLFFVLKVVPLIIYQSDLYTGSATGRFITEVTNTTS